jgi:hypothetical protein
MLWDLRVVRVVLLVEKAGEASEAGFVSGHLHGVPGCLADE